MNYISLEQFEEIKIFFSVPKLIIKVTVSGMIFLSKKKKCIEQNKELCIILIKHAFIHFFYAVIFIHQKSYNYFGAEYCLMYNFFITNN